MATTRTSITNVMAIIQNSMVTTILNGINKTNAEKLVNKVTTE